jgi:PPK2 family polyphosphate:nucleotide phosphotransferase
LKEINESLVKNLNFNLADIDADNTFGKNRDDLELELTKLRTLLFDLQSKLYAENKNAVLIVLQGMDTSGKDGTIKHVISALNPAWCDVTSFKKPTSIELSHDFLWRIHKAVPPVGFVGVFNRSHYEDIVEAKIQKLAPESHLSNRYDHINYFEKILTENKVKIIKLFLHISKDEQRKRLAERASDPEKRWKEDSTDYKRRKKWKEYSKAYNDVIVRCGVKYVPWYVIPSNKKWFRNWIIAMIICQTLKELI